MPTRKQRRRRAKDLRHEWEYVYVDEEGHEVAVDERTADGAGKAADERERRNGKVPAAKAAKKPQARRPVREVPPPTLKRAGTRAAMFAALLFVLTSFIGKTQPPIYSRVALALMYGVIAVPFFFWMDRLAYRRYQRQIGEAPPPKAKRR